MHDQLLPLINKSIVRSFSNGSTILYQGEVPRSACIVKRGIVCAFNISQQGEEQIIAYHVAGEFFPSSWIFGKTQSTLYFYRAVGDCEIAFVPRGDLIAYMCSDEQRMHTLLDYFTTNYTALMIRIMALEQAKAREKLMYTLYFLCLRYGTKQAHGTDIGLSLTHQNIAALVGLTRETTATEMNKLKKEKVLTYENQKYTVNVAKLLSLMSEDSFKDITIA